jgi:hypothetical protein
MPNNDSPKKFHEFIEERVNSSSVKQTDIASALGYDKPNLVTMFKQGKTKVPLDKVPKFAKVLEIDPKMLLRKWMSEYDPAMLKMIEDYFGDIITKNERAILDEIRRLSNGSDPHISNVRGRVALENFVKEIVI